MASIVPYPAESTTAPHRSAPRSPARRSAPRDAAVHSDARDSLSRSRHRERDDSEISRRARAFVRELRIEADTIPWDEERRVPGSRLRRILNSIQRDVDAGGIARVRQITSAPLALYRIEVERPDMAYLRTTVMTYDALTALLEDTPEQTIRDRFVFRCP